MKPIIVLGGGGHAKVVMEALQLRNQKIIGFTDPLTVSTILGISWLGNDEFVDTYSPEDILLVNGLGSVWNNTKRKKLFHYWKERGFSFANVIHPSAIVSANAVLDEGVQIMAGAVIQAGVRTGSNSIINTRATVDHDTSIGKHVHIAPGVTLSGGVTIEDDTHVGTGAVVIQGLTIGRNSMIAAGAVVVKDLPADAKVAGVPARNM